MLQKKYFDGVEVVSVNEDELRAALNDAAGRIRREHPEAEELILFGSFAKGNFTAYSDVDIAIIVERAEKKFIERQDEFIDYFLSIPLDVNVLVYTRSEIEGMLKKRNSFIREILKGVRL